MPTLFQVTEEFHALDDLLHEIGGDVTDPQVAAIVDTWLAELDTDLNRKVDNYAAFITELSGRAEVRLAEAHRLAKRAKIDETTAAWLKGRLKQAFEARGLSKINTDRYRVSVQVSGGVQKMELTGPVPIAFQTQPPPVPNTDQIRSALDRGDELEFARLMPRGTHLRIN